jgi:hypothetical protein
VLVLLLFLALALLLTYPLLLNLGHGVRDAGDPLLNSWILAWDVRKIVHLDWKDFFDANIFYPYKKTLAYSEFLFTQSLFALPVLLISGNPILAHNVVLLLAFITSGFGMYLLAWHLTKSTAAGIIAGMIYAFSPFMFAHLSQLQVLSAGGIPLAFLFLLRFFSTDSYRDLFLFTLFYILQVLANGYYALYLTLFAALVIIYRGIVQRKYSDKRFWLKLGTLILAAIIVTGPFFYQYLRVRQEMGFTRQGGHSAKLVNFLASPPINRLYGNTAKFALSPEGKLFPGAIALLMALVGLVFGLKFRMEKAKQNRNQNQRTARVLLAVKIILDGLILFCLATIIFLTCFKEFRMPMGDNPAFSAHRLINPILILFVLLAARLIMARLSKKKIARLVVREGKDLLLYAGILILAFLLAFGVQGPYYFLNKYVPGFDGLRVASRFHIFVMFSLAVLAAFGVRSLLTKLKGWKKMVLASLIALLVLAEYVSIPIPVTKIPVKEDIPEVYRWLASQKEDFALLELPLPRPLSLDFTLESRRLYFSTYHWKRLVNGASGYYSPLYVELLRRWPRSSLRQNIEDLNPLNVRYLLLHSDQFSQKEFSQMISQLLEMKNDLRFVNCIGKVHILEFIASSGDLTRGAAKEKKTFVSRKGLKVRTNANEDLAHAAVDGSLATRWESGPQERGQFFQVDLGSIEQLKGISLSLGSCPEDYPRGYSVEVSADGLVWQEVARRETARLPLTAYLQPKVIPLEIAFAQTETRYVRITNLGEDPVYSWSICELGLIK